MEAEEILRRVDHTLLTQTATWAEIQRACDEALRFHTASACIPPSYVKRAADYTGGALRLCTVIGFPNGYATTAVKALEAADAVRSGAHEIDMVIHLGSVKDGDDGAVLEELWAVKSACAGRVLKVIVETCLLTGEEKIRLCRLVSQAGADYIKTSTGFSTGGATLEDVDLFRAHLAPHVKIKASGGIRTLEDAERLIRHGADRVGASALVKLVMEKQKRNQA